MKDFFRDMILAVRSRKDAEEASCPCCGYEGKFRGAGTPVRFGAQCPKCKALERHRLFARAIDEGFFDLTGKDVVHFAPEPAVAHVIRKARPDSYRTSSYPDNSADLCLNIEKIDLPDNSLDAVVCSHILEHVDDVSALAELYRVLRPGGQLVVMVPIVERWPTTYENPSISSPEGRTLHFGQWNHVRFYGRDLRDRIRKAGFVLSEYTATPADVIRYRLQRGETVFLGQKPGAD